MIADLTLNRGGKMIFEFQFKKQLAEAEARVQNRVFLQRR